MLELIAGDKVISSARPQLLKLNEKDKVLAFERNGFFFFFNFHPVKSQVDYSVITLPGEYVLVLDSDSGEFGGHNRIHAGQHYFTSPEKHGNEQVNVL
jgi:1,4-alpha-glucan branching enzyme